MWTTLGTLADGRARSCSVQICHLLGSGVLLGIANDDITLVLFWRHRFIELDTTARFLRPATWWGKLAGAVRL